MDRPADRVPHHLFGQNAYLKEYGDTYKIPLTAHLSGAKTKYPKQARGGQN